VARDKITNVAVEETERRCPTYRRSLMRYITLVACLQTRHISITQYCTNKKLTYRLETGRQLCILCSSVTFHRRNYLRPSRSKRTSDEPADLLHTANKIQLRQLCSTCVNARSHYPLTHFPAKPREYPHKSYIARKQSSCWIFASLQQWVCLYSFSRSCLRKPISQGQHTTVKAELDVKWPFKVIQGHMFWG